jgi:hypothetical protein
MVESPQRGQVTSPAEGHEFAMKARSYIVYSLFFGLVIAGFSYIAFWVPRVFDPDLAEPLYSAVKAEILQHEADTYNPTKNGLLNPEFDLFDFETGEEGSNTEVLFAWIEAAKRSVERGEESDRSSQYLEQRQRFQQVLPLLQKLAKYEFICKPIESPWEFRFNDQYIAPATQSALGFYRLDRLQEQRYREYLDLLPLHLELTNQVDNRRLPGTLDKRAISKLTILAEVLWNDTKLDLTADQWLHLAHLTAEAAPNPEDLKELLTFQAVKKVERFKKNREGYSYIMSPLKEQAERGAKNLLCEFEGLTSFEELIDTIERCSVDNIFSALLGRFGLVASLGGYEKSFAERLRVIYFEFGALHLIALVKAYIIQQGHVPENLESFYEAQRLAFPLFQIQDVRYEPGNSDTAKLIFDRNRVGGPRDWVVSGIEIVNQNIEIEGLVLTYQL